MTQKKKKKCLCVDDKISGALPMYDEETKNALLHVKAEHNIASLKHKHQYSHPKIIRLNLPNDCHV